MRAICFRANFRCVEVRAVIFSAPHPFLFFDEAQTILIAARRPEGEGERAKERERERGSDLLLQFQSQCPAVETGVAVNWQSTFI